MIALDKSLAKKSARFATSSGEIARRKGDLVIVALTIASMSPIDLAAREAEVATLFDTLVA